MLSVDGHGLDYFGSATPLRVSFELQHGTDGPTVKTAGQGVLRMMSVRDLLQRRISSQETARMKAAFE